MKKDSMMLKAYTAIKQMIISNELAPGTVVNESDLQEILGIGRTPIHEALLRLSVEQFVTIIPRRGIMRRCSTLLHVIFLRSLRRSRGIVPCNGLCKW